MCARSAFSLMGLWMDFARCAIAITESAATAAITSKLRLSWFRFMSQSRVQVQSLLAISWHFDLKRADKARAFPAKAQLLGVERKRRQVAALHINLRMPSR